MHAIQRPTAIEVGPPQAGKWFVARECERAMVTAVCGAGHAGQRRQRMGGLMRGPEASRAVPSASPERRVRTVYGAHRSTAHASRERANAPCPLKLSSTPSPSARAVVGDRPVAAEARRFRAGLTRRVVGAVHSVRARIGPHRRGGLAAVRRGRAATQSLATTTADAYETDESSIDTHCDDWPRSRGRASGPSGA
jgi:hypothetical protein